MKTGLLEIGNKSCGLMKLKLITSDQMGRFMFGNNKESQYQTEPQHQLSNMEEETISWYGVVWAKMEWESLLRFRGR